MRDYVASVLKEEARHFFPLEPFVRRIMNFFVAKIDYDPSDWDGQDDLGLMPLAMERFKAVSDNEWQRVRLGREIQFLQKELLRRNPTSRKDDTAWPKKVERKVQGQLRHAVLGSKPGPPMSVTMELLGKSSTLARLLDRHQGRGVKGPKSPANVETTQTKATPVVERGEKRERSQTAKREEAGDETLTEFREAGEVATAGRN